MDVILAIIGGLYILGHVLVFLFCAGFIFWLLYKFFAFIFSMIGIGLLMVGITLYSIIQILT